MPRFLPGGKKRVESVAAKRDDDPYSREQSELRDQIGSATHELFSRGLVGRRSTPGGRANEGVMQLEPIVPVDRDRLIRKTESVQGLIEPVAASIAGEHPSGSIRSVCRRSQSDYEKPGSRISEAWHRFAPILLGGETARLDPRDVLPVLHESRAESAVGYLSFQLCEFIHVGPRRQ